MSAAAQAMPLLLGLGAIEVDEPHRGREARRFAQEGSSPTRG